MTGRGRRIFRVRPNRREWDCRLSCATRSIAWTLRLAAPKGALAGFPKLKVVIRMGLGSGRVDCVNWAERGLTLCNMPDNGIQEMADAAMTCSLAA